MSVRTMTAMRLPNDVFLIALNAWDNDHYGQRPDEFSLARTKPLPNATPDDIWNCFETVAHIHQGTQ